MAGEQEKKGAKLPPPTSWLLLPHCVEYAGPLERGTFADIGAVISSLLCGFREVRLILAQWIYG